MKIAPELLKAILFLPSTISQPWLHQMASKARLEGAEAVLMADAADTAINEMFRRSQESTLTLTDLEDIVWRHRIAAEDCVHKLA
jgi:hypothetical protein